MVEIKTPGGSGCLVSIILRRIMQAEHSPQLASYPLWAPDQGLPPSHSLQDVTITSSDEEPEELPPGPAMGKVERPTITAPRELPGATADHLSLMDTCSEVGYMFPTL